MLTKQKHCKGVLNITKFYDTNALLELQEDAFKETFLISDETLREIEHIKTSSRKDEDVKYRARHLARLLDQHNKDYITVNYNFAMEKQLINFELQTDSPDNRIVCCAYTAYQSNNDLVFVSDDLCCKNIARNIFNIPVEGVELPKDDYSGFKEVVMDNTAMAFFYEHPDTNTYKLNKNEYLIIKDLDKRVVDCQRWTGNIHTPINRKTIKSLYFDKLNTKDIYQACVVDSILSNTITAISGRAGSGKSLLSLMTSMYLIEKGEYDCIVVLFNPSKTRGASDMGYYSGDFYDKAMQNSIGQILTTKFGDRYAVDMLIQKNKLKLVSMADARGMEIKDNEILWITECQNTSVDLIKLCLSRVSSGAKVIIEGDYLSQTDSYAYEGKNNGLKRAIDKFKNHEEFGYIQLQNVWRSKIAELCELL